MYRLTAEELRFLEILVLNKRREEKHTKEPICTYHDAQADLDILRLKLRHAIEVENAT